MRSRHSTTSPTRPGGRPQGRRTAPLVAAVAASALLAVPALPAGAAAALPAAPAPASPATPGDRIAEVQRQVHELEARAESATEAYNGARIRATEIQRRVVAARARVEASAAAVDGAQDLLGLYARAAYRTGGLDATMQVFLADSPSAFLAGVAAVDQLGRSQTSALRRGQTARLRLTQARDAVAQEEAMAAQVAAEMAAARSATDADLARARALLDTLEAQERARLEAERRARVAAQRRAAAAAAAQAAAARAAAADAAAQDAASDGSGTGDPGDPGPVSDRAAAALSYALAQVGDAYVATAAGPDAFDCSGLTMAAWARAGVSLPHYSYSQWDVTSRVDRADLRPGDLLFYFGQGAHHVTIYIGGGRMVSASNPSKGVEIIDAWGPWYGERYSGAGRVVG